MRQLTLQIKMYYNWVMKCLQRPKAVNNDHCYDDALLPPSMKF